MIKILLCLWILPSLLLLMCSGFAPEPITDREWAAILFWPFVILARGCKGFHEVLRD